MKKYYCLILVMTVILFSLFSQTENTERKIALIVGNSSYEEPLPNAVSNVESMRILMENLGFTVYAYTNLDQSALVKAVQDFNREIKDASAALLYFSGYTYQSAVDGYILPVNTIAGSEEDLAYKGISLSDIFMRMSRAACPKTFVFMDTVSYRGFLEEYEESKELRIPPEAKDMEGIYSLGTISDSFFTNPQTPVTPLTKALSDLLKTENTDIRILYGDIAKRAQADSQGNQILQTSTTLFEDYYLVKTDTFVTKEALQETVLQKEAERIDLLNQRLAEKAELEKQYASAVKKLPVLWTLGGIDILAGGTALVTGILGFPTYKLYNTSTNPDEITAAKQESKVYSYFLSTSLITAGVLTSAIITIAILPPQKKSVEKQLASVKTEIIRLGGSVEKDAAGGESGNKVLSE